MAVFPKAYLNAIVSIEKDDHPIATGFLIGRETSKKGFFNVLIVTNKHVFNKQKELTFRLNNKEGKAIKFVQELQDKNGKPIWYQHNNPKIDLAVLPISVDVLKRTTIDYYFFKDGAGKDVFFAKDFAKEDIDIGNGVFVFGFPRGIRGENKNTVIVRKGIISRVDDEILAEGFFYIDAHVYPGNSGGPVILKPELMSIKGTKNNMNSRLIGVISSVENYEDIAISQQTKKPRIVFTESMNLARVIPVEYIYEIISTIKYTEE